MKIILALSKQTSPVPFLVRKISIVKSKVRKVEWALAKAQKHLEPEVLPIDFELVTTEEYDVDWVIPYNLFKSLANEYDMELSAPLQPWG